MRITENIEKAADLIRAADGLVVTAGAGIGVDSGLPDFRGQQGFWKAYPALRRQGLYFEDVANPATFVDAPRLTWGFYGHRLQLYRSAVPHEGFKILLDLAADMTHGAFVYTSNVDGQFQKAGFSDDRIVECHGSIHYLQCLNNCTSEIWSAEGLVVDVDADACLLRIPLPTCRHCGHLARPNILMFGDWSWIPDRTDKQKANFEAWRRSVQRPVVIEIGAGVDLPTIRHKGTSLRVPMIRINPCAAEVTGPENVGLPLGAREALQRIAVVLGLST
ncbi:MAG TPA: Sir2 family NAD-dependent protein deacetylase [Noviherbaspirillum sp.]|nr:Sir2 family NAD-dependent protein deacetylase [Noviherbaspirillum sp.]